MKLIVGLGNPGSAYGNTRHNAGFMVIDRFIEKHEITEPWREHSLAHANILTTKIDSETVVFVKPQTYMNKSGHAVASLLGEYVTDPHDLIVVYDDFDLDLGFVRVRNSGSSGGHNGVQSLIDVLKSDNFIRVRLGIGNKDDSYFVDKKIPRQDYVLMPFLQLEHKKLESMLNTAAEYLLLLIKEPYSVFISKHHQG